MSRPAKVAKMGGAWRGEAALATACARRRRASNSGRKRAVHGIPPPTHTHGPERGERATSDSNGDSDRDAHKGDSAWSDDGGATALGRGAPDGGTGQWRSTTSRWTSRGVEMARDAGRLFWGNRVTVILAGTAES